MSPVQKHGDPLLNGWHSEPKVLALLEAGTGQGRTARKEDGCLSVCLEWTLKRPLELSFYSVGFAVMPRAAVRRALTSRRGDVCVSGHVTHSPDSLSGRSHTHTHVRLSE